jgi:type II secretory pathway component PulM
MPSPQGLGKGSFSLGLKPIYFWMLLTLGMALLTAGAGYFFIHIPWQDHRSQLEAELNRQIQRSHLVDEIRDTLTQIHGLETQHIWQGGSSALTAEISRLGSQAGLQIESVTPQGAILVENPYQVVQIALRASASFNGVLAFLHSLETHRPSVWIGTLEIERSPLAYRESEWRGASSWESPRGLGSQLPKIALTDLNPEQHKVQIVVWAIVSEGAVRS